MTRDYAKITKATVITSGTSIMRKKRRKKTFKKYDLLKKKIYKLSTLLRIALLRITTYLYTIKQNLFI